MSVKSLPCWIALILLTGCEHSIMAPKQQLSTGAPLQLMQQSVGASGGTMVVNLPGDSLNGLTVMIPSGALSALQTVTITATSLKSNPFGAHFTPISPLIRIDGITGYVQDVIQITVPIHKKPGDFAMGFFYNESTQKLEGLPLFDLTDTSVTVGTRVLSAEGGLSKKKAQTSTKSLVDLIVSSFTESMLAGTGILSTSFTPGIDDWEFTNYGSYIAPSGHCAGQSISSMWYWYEIKLNGGINLYHGYDRDKTNNLFWQDNPYGYRLASVVQADLNWDGLQRILWANIRQYLPPLSYRAFAAAMLVTGEPQYAGINAPNIGGHALVAYKMDYANGKIWVADPNWPGNTNRFFTYGNSTFQPYSSALNAGDKGISFTQIGYFGKTAFIDWDKIGARYKEFRDSTIGTNPPNIFPHATLWRLDKDSGALADSSIVDSSSLPVQNRCADCQAAWSIGNSAKFQLMSVFDTEGTTLYSTTSTNLPPSGITVLQLDPGPNVLGFYLLGSELTGKDSLGNNIFKDKFVNFIWRKIFYKKMDLEPQDTSIEPNAPLTMTAHCYEIFPKKWHIKWSIEDTGGIRDTVIFAPDSSVIKRWPVPGHYSVACYLMDDVSGKLFTADSTTVTVGVPSLLAKLKQCVRINFFLGGMDTVGMKLNDGMPLQGIKIANWNGQQGVAGTISWDTTYFSLPYQLSTSMGGTVSSTTGMITGRISASGTSIDTMTLTTHTVVSDTIYAGMVVVETTDDTIALRHFPLVGFDTVPQQIDIGNQVDSTDIKPLVTGVQWRMVSTVNGSGNTDELLSTINWTDPNLYMTVDFTDK
jgi:hypothetical protein